MVFLPKSTTRSMQIITHHRQSSSKSITTSSPTIIAKHHGSSKTVTNPQDPSSRSIINHSTTKLALNFPCAHGHTHRAGPEPSSQIVANHHASSPIFIKKASPNHHHHPKAHFVLCILSPPCIPTFIQPSCLRTPTPTTQSLAFNDRMYPLRRTFSLGGSS